MNQGRQYQTPSCFLKEWPLEFRKDRGYKQNEFDVAVKRMQNADDDGLSLFLRDQEFCEPSCEVDEIEAFAKEAKLSDLESGNGTSGLMRRIWLDDRNSEHGGAETVRQYQNPLTPTALYRHLHELRYGHPDKPDVNRRLMYFWNLDPNSILALGETATEHQAPVLKDAIWKHLAYQTSIKVNEPPGNYPVLSIELHLPYFELAKMTLPNLSTTIQVNETSPRKFIDLAFLEIDSLMGECGEQYGIYEAHFSFVTIASDDRRYTGYAFDSTHLENTDLEEDSFSSYEYMLEDPIAPGDIKRNANRPRWDCREYVLDVFDMRTARILKKWAFLVRNIERAIKAFRKKHSYTLFNQRSAAGSEQADNSKKLFDWTQQTMQLLSQLLDPLSRSNIEWERFRSSDIRYFTSPPVDDKLIQSLRSINVTFETLAGLQQTLLTSEKSCRDLAESLQLRLTLEGYQAVRRTGAATDFTISFLAPITLAIGYFSIPGTATPMQLESKYFLLFVGFAMIMVRVLFNLVATLPWWWRGINAWVKRMQLEAADWSRLANFRNRGNLSGNVEEDTVIV